MASIERTAYPRFARVMCERELRELYSLSGDEIDYIRSTARGRASQLTLAVMLKTRQQLGYFPSLKEVPNSVREILAAQLKFALHTPLLDSSQRKTSIHRHRAALRTHLSSRPYAHGGRRFLTQVVRQAAETMSDPADLINCGIEALIKENIELPAFSTLGRVVGHLREQVHDDIFSRVVADLSNNQKSILNDLLVVPEGKQITGFTKIKQSPGTPTITRIKQWADRLAWLTALLNPEPFLSTVAHTKVRQFAAEAAASEISDMRNSGKRARRYTLLLCLLYEAQAKTRDDLVEMFLRRMKKTENAAKEKLNTLHRTHREIEETLMSGFAHVLQQADQDNLDDSQLGRSIRESLNDLGGIKHLQQQYTAVSAYHHNNYLPLMISIHAKNRSILFSLLELLQVRSTNQDDNLVAALNFVMQHRQTRRDYLPADINLDFVSERWKEFVVDQRQGKSHYDRRALEICVLWHVAEELKGCNLYVEGSLEYSDPRTQLLSLEECQQRLPAYYKALGLPDTPKEIVKMLCEQLKALANQVDACFPENTALTLGQDGRPHLKRQPKAPIPENLDTFKTTVRARMPEHHLLDILNSTNHWTQFTRHFGPPSGTDPKLSEPTLRYLFTLFGYGCFLGPRQTERHAPEMVNRQTLRRINAQHVTVEKLETALRDLINEYARFPLLSFWGPGKAAIADGTHIELVENNLMGERHIRYGGYGGIAYHHIADNYIALFCHFIACGVWEAVYILDGLMKNTSDIQPDTLHADTHGQSEPVFALAYLLGIKLFPRMRNWNDVKFYRHSKKACYQHINALFTETIDWNLIEQHIPDMLQVVLSIQAGKVMPSMLLRKLGSRSRKNKLYRAFRELGRVERTQFLLNYISDKDFRFDIRAETTKIESFHAFMDWIAFGGNVIKSGDPVEQAKRMKYLDVIANAIMLHNVADLTQVLNGMAKDGFQITPELIATLSPYMREHILRFGQLTLDVNKKPEPLMPESIAIAA